MTLLAVSAMMLRIPNRDRKDKFMGAFNEILNFKLPVGNDLTISSLISSLLTLLLCLVVIRAVLKVVSRLLSKSKLDDRIQRYLVGGLKLLLYILTVIIVVDGLGIKVSSLVALLSVGSLGITLAAEDILSNVAGGLVILSSHPFAIGDVIEVGGTLGTVQEISLNHTKLLTPDGQLVLLPNKELANSKMTNYSVMGKRRIKQEVTASYDAPADVVKAACLTAVSRTPNVLEDPAPQVFVTNYGSSAIEYTVYCWSAPENFFLSSMALSENLRAAFEESDIEMTYDHLNVHLVEDRTK